jgi:hypothetical protein
LVAHSQERFDGLTEEAALTALAAAACPQADIDRFAEALRQLLDDH